MSSLARRLGLDRSPLRRGTDRIEAWLRIALILVFVIGAPLTGWGAARWAESVAPSAAHAQRAGEHRVTATLLHNVPNSSDYLAPVSLGWVKARWTVPGGSVRTGYIEAPSGSRAGSTMQVWLDPSGIVTAPPVPASQIRDWVFLMTVLAPIVLALMMLALMALFARILEQRRLASWEQAWSAVEPQWSRRRH